MENQTTPPGLKFDTLTKREQEVALLLSRGDAMPEIAAALGISQKTVDTHRGHILRKLDVKNNVGMLRVLIREGKVQP